jgi:hypothetical protein
LYVSTQINRPNLVNSTWQSGMYGSDTISIDKMDPEYCSLCTYYIAVNGFKDSTYSLSVSLRSDSVVLTDGISVSASLEMAQYDYYRFIYTYGSTSSMRIVVTTVTPQDTVSVYVNLDNNIPYDSDYSYTTTTGNSGHDGVIIISKEDPKFSPCTSPDPLAATSCVVRIAVYNPKLSNAGHLFCINIFSYM